MSYFRAAAEGLQQQMTHAIAQFDITVGDVSLYGFFEPGFPQPSIRLKVLAREGGAVGLGDCLTPRRRH